MCYLVEILSIIEMGGGSLSVAVFLLLITSLYMRTHLCMIHVFLLEGCFSWVVTGTLASLSVTGYFQPFLSRHSPHYYKSFCSLKAFLPLGPVIIFPLFQVLIQNNYMVVGLTLPRRKGKRGKLFWCGIRNFIPYDRNSPVESSKGEG